MDRARLALEPLTRFAVLVLLAGLAACEAPTSSAVASHELLEMGADNIVFGMTSFMTSNGIREGKVEADTAFMYADSAKAKLRQMRIVFYDEAGAAKATVTGTAGEWDRNTDRMWAQGDVVLIVHADGRRIESAEIIYDPVENEIWSDSATVQTLANGRVTRGSSFRSDMDFTNVRIANIRGAIAR
ncbi:MAG TPA: LPS export ABC transporter periplasmic protein LptC [Gemmatimonadetes bacterium]|nr:LPS export ABC transporter periplasmic protein LptC [Gemmatimonadota bacterium]